MDAKIRFSHCGETQKIAHLQRYHPPYFLGDATKAVGTVMLQPKINPERQVIASVVFLHSQNASQKANVLAAVVGDAVACAIAGEHHVAGVHDDGAAVVGDLSFPL